MRPDQPGSSDDVRPKDPGGTGGTILIGGLILLFVIVLGALLYLAISD